MWISNGGLKKRAEKGEFFCRYRRVIDNESCVGCGRLELEGRMEMLSYRRNWTGNSKCYLILSWGIKSRSSSALELNLVYLLVVRGSYNEVSVGKLA